MKKQPISWDEEQSLVNEICNQIEQQDQWYPDYVIGITRGGLIPATMISHRLNVPMSSLDVSLRDHAFTVSDCGKAEDAYQGTNILIVDDINDTGATFNWIMNDWKANHLPDCPTWKSVWNKNVRFAVVVDNLSSGCDVQMDYAGLEIDKGVNNVWIDFPYETWWEDKESK